MTVTESFLRRLLRRYPHGKIFNFDDDGLLSSSEDDARKSLQDEVNIISGDAQETLEEPINHRRKKRMSKEAEGQEILKILPGARCVAFFPLWDAHKERWFAGTLLWTTNSTRILDPEEDLTYLASFGNSIMAEISRMEALVTSQAKNSFVSSISHELRSPLHGVLVGVEFLQDSPLNPLQQEMVNIIGSCGRTLLDTMNHVLDFTKFKKPSDSRPDQSPPISPENSSIQVTDSVDLCVLAEEVVEGVYAGSAFGKSASTTRFRNPTPHSDFSLAIPIALSPMIVVSMEWRSNWEFAIDHGAWRRLVMNIVGNALKYTDSGFVRISLGSRDETDPLTGIISSVVILTVTDSGKGISQEFLNHHVYTPFAQEDSLAVGSGLGLTIVRHIVSELGGSITIESEQDLGTNVIVSLPLGATKLSAPPDGVQDIISPIRSQTDGLNACLVGFNVVSNLDDESAGILSIETRRMFYLKDSLTALAKDWFAMEVSVEANLNPSTADVYFIMESTLNDLLLAGFQDPEPSLSRHRKPILLVLCTRPYQSCPAVTHRDFEIIHVQQPYVQSPYLFSKFGLVPFFSQTTSKTLTMQNRTT